MWRFLFNFKVLATMILDEHRKITLIISHTYLYSFTRFYQQTQLYPILSTILSQTNY